MIRAIETRYKGYRFRSRLEARWAVFLDTLGLKWEYESEGFELPSGWYLPDFLVQTPGWGDPMGLVESPVWMEVKPDMPSWPTDFRRLWELTAHEPIPLWILAGSPWPKEHKIICIGAAHYLQPMPDSFDWFDTRQYDCITKCRRCEGYCLLADGQGFCNVGKHTCGDHDRWPLVPSESYASEVFGAYQAARSARFEFGESGGKP